MIMPQIYYIFVPYTQIRTGRVFIPSEPILFSWGEILLLLWLCIPIHCKGIYLFSYTLISLNKVSNFLSSSQTHLFLDSFHFSSVAQLCRTLCNPRNHSMPGLPVHHQLLESFQTHVHWVGDAIQLSHPLSSPSPPALNLYQHQGLFQWVSSSIRWPKYWSFSFNISLSNEHPGLISFKMDWLDLLAVQGTLKSHLQNYISKASILLCSAFFIVQLSHPYMTAGKSITLTIWTFVSKVMSLFLICCLGWS